MPPPSLKRSRSRVTTAFDKIVSETSYKVIRTFEDLLTANGSHFLQHSNSNGYESDGSEAQHNHKFGEIATHEIESIIGKMFQEATLVYLKSINNDEAPLNTILREWAGGGPAGPDYPTTLARIVEDQKAKIAQMHEELIKAKAQVKKLKSKLKKSEGQRRHVSREVSSSSEQPVPERAYLNPFPDERHHAWYHGEISREDAHALLKGSAYNGAYLVRKSVNSPSQYVLSVLWSGYIRHLRMRITEHECLIDDRRFFTVYEMLETYRREGLPARISPDNTTLLLSRAVANRSTQSPSAGGRRHTGSSTSSLGSRRGIQRGEPEHASIRISKASMATDNVYQ